MSGFENELVGAFNTFFEENGVDGVAYRIRQSKYTAQICDILVDSPRKEFYLAIENKSIKRDNRKKLYFSQHFSTKKDTHQVERIARFLHKSGRNGLLALEVRYGRGKPKRAFLAPWAVVADAFNTQAGLSIAEMEEDERVAELEREDGAYAIEEGALWHA